MHCNKEWINVINKEKKPSDPKSNLAIQSVYNMGVESIISLFLLIQNSL